MSDIYIWEKPSTLKRDKPNASSERRLQKDYDRKDSDAKKKKPGHDPHESWRQNELTDGKTVRRKVTLTLT
jgi:hypothetical protein